MSKDTFFSVDDHLEEFIANQVSQGRYSDPSEVVRAALRLLEEQEATASIKSEERGPAIHATETGMRQSLYGLMRGTVQIPEGFDLTAPVFDGEIHADDGRIHE